MSKVSDGENEGTESAYRGSIAQWLYDNTCLQCRAGEHRKCFCDCHQKAGTVGLDVRWKDEAMRGGALWRGESYRYDVPDFMPLLIALQFHVYEYCVRHHLTFSFDTAALTKPLLATHSGDGPESFTSVDLGVKVGHLNTDKTPTKRWDLPPNYYVVELILEYPETTNAPEC